MKKFILNKIYNSLRCKRWMCGCLLLSFIIVCGSAQVSSEPSEKIIVNSLFEYPSAPEEMTSLTERTNYIMEHFWDKMDFKSKKAVDQNALNDAFNVYATAMQYSDGTSVDESVNKLLKMLSKNPVLLYQFTKAAEENLYGPRAGVWIDEIYIKFLKETVKNKKISRTRKIRFADQLKRLENSLIGEKLPTLTLTDADGNKFEWVPTATLNILEFGSPDCDDCRNARIKMDINIPFMDSLKEGKSSMTFVVIEDDEDGLLMRFTRDFSSDWKSGQNSDVPEFLDLRLTPSFYIVDNEGKILAKNLDVLSMMDFVKNYSTPSSN